MQQCGEIGNCWTLSETSWNLDWHLYLYNTIVYGKTLQKVMGNPSSRQLQTPGKAEKKSLGNTVKRSQMMPPVHWLFAWYAFEGLHWTGFLVFCSMLWSPLCSEGLHMLQLRADVWYLASYLHIQRQTLREYEYDRTRIVFSPLVKLHRCKPE